MRFVFDLAQLDVEGWIPLSGRVTALVHSETQPELERLPGFRTVREETLGDETRTSRHLRSGGEPYNVDRMIEGLFALPMSKPEAYASSLRGLMTDFVTAIRDPFHQIRVTLEDGLASLDIALRATEHARQVG